MDRNVLKIGFFGFRYTIRHPVRFVIHLCRNLQYAWQRITRGWCDMDVWNFDSWYLNLIPAMLDYLAQSSNGYPGTPPFETPEKWEKWLHGIAANLRLCTEDAAEKLNEYYESFMESMRDKRHTTVDDQGNTHVYYGDDDKLSEKYFARLGEIAYEQQALLEETMTELGKHLYKIWD